MFIAKSILDGFTFSQDYFYEPDRTSWKNRYMREEYEWSGRVGKDNFGRDWFGKLNLNTVLRNHEVEPVVKVKQKEIRSSFDSLLDFFGKLEYLLTNHLIKNKEIGYFRLYLEKAAEVQAIQQYIRIYRFPLYGKLNSKLRYDYHE